MNEQEKDEDIVDKKANRTILEWRRRFRHRGNKIKSLKLKVKRLEKEADWLANELIWANSFARIYAEKEPITVEYLREAARKAVEEQCRK